MRHLLHRIGTFLFNFIIVAVILCVVIAALYGFLPTDVNISVKDADFIAAGISIDAGYFWEKISNAYVFLNGANHFSFDSCWVEADGNYYDGKLLRVMPENWYEYESEEEITEGWQDFYILVRDDSTLTVTSESASYHFPAVYIWPMNVENFFEDTIAVNFKNRTTFSFNGFVELYSGYESCFMITDASQAINAERFPAVYEETVYNEYDETAPTENGHAIRFSQCKLYPKKSQFFSNSAKIVYYPWRDTHPTYEEIIEESKFRKAGVDIPLRDYENKDEPPAAYLEMILETRTDSMATIELAEVNNISVRMDGALYKSYGDIVEDIQIRFQTIEVTESESTNIERSSGHEKDPLICSIDPIKNKISFSGNVSELRMDEHSIRPGIQNWFVKNIYTSPIPLITILLSAIGLTLKGGEDVRRQKKSRYSYYDTEKRMSVEVVEKGKLKKIIEKIQHSSVKCNSEARKR